MPRYRACSDDFYVNLNLNTELELTNERDSVLHFFEQLRKKYPTMRNFYCRERGEGVLEEDKECGQYRWATIESKRICSGYVNPDSVGDAMEQHAAVLDIAPYCLSVNALDCESLNLMYGFDFTYRGNHNQLVAEALGICTGLEGLVDLPGASAIAYEPALQIALDEDCRLQCRLSVETRTSAYHVRTGNYPEEQISVYVTARRYGSLDPGETFLDVLQRLNELCAEVVDQYVVEQVLVPLQQTIAMK